MRHTERACPFCGATDGQLEKRIAPDTTARLGRAAAFVFATSVAISCGSEVTVRDGDSTNASGPSASSSKSATSSTVGAGGAGGATTGDGGGIAPPYGTPVGGMGGAAGSDGGSGQPLYGAAPAD